MKRRTVALLALTPLALVAAGCASTATDDSTAAAPTAAVRPSTSLAAGDNAGHALFASPVAIGPMNSPNAAVYATVPVR